VVLALDVGTSSLRAGAYRRDGRLLVGSEAAWLYQPDVRSDGGVEVEAVWLLDRLAEVVDGAVARLARCPARPLAVAASHFWHSLLGINAQGRPVTPVWLWADTRAAGEIAGLSRRLSTPSSGDYHQRTGAPLHSSFWPAKLAWWRRYDPARVARVAHWVSFAEYAELQWFGTLRCSVSMASATGLWNYAERRWDRATRRVCRVDPGQLSPVSDLAQQGLRGPWARRWPTLAQLPWFPAWGDGACANLGSGAARSGQIAITVGTSSALRTVIPHDLGLTLPGSLWRYAVDERRHLVGGALSEGGNVYRWLLDRLRLGGPPRPTPSNQPNNQPNNAAPPQLSPAELRVLSAMAPDSHGLTLLPFLAGERSPGWQSDRRASLVGLSLGTTPLDLVRAGMEAVALRLAAVHDDLLATLNQRRRRTSILAGGAALHHSALWTQILADTLGSPITRLAVAEASARGAALLAWERLGGPSVESAPAPERDRYLPRPAATAIYTRARRRQDRLYHRLRQGE